MILVFGGAFNGKLDFALSKYNLKKDDVCFCDSDSLNFNKKIICGLHQFIFSSIKQNKSPIEFLKNNENLLRNKIIICDDLNSGIVPMDKLNRQWREENGKAIQWLSKKATVVYRIFFGLETVIKDEEN